MAIDWSEDCSQGKNTSTKNTISTPQIKTLSPGKEQELVGIDAMSSEWATSCYVITMFDELSNYALAQAKVPYLTVISSTLLCRTDRLFLYLGLADNGKSSQKPRKHQKSSASPMDLHLYA